jgi:hypothetical protein
MSKRMKNQSPPSLRVIVTVSGGVADVLFKPQGVAVTLCDYDIEGCSADEPGIATDPDGQLCCMREWGPSEKIVGCESWPVVKTALEGSYCRTWKCPDCGQTIEHSYEALAEAGTPICTDCDTEMDLL